MYLAEQGGPGMSSAMLASVDRAGLQPIRSENHFALEGLLGRLRRGDWIFGSVLPTFRVSLLDRAKRRVPSVPESSPTAVLTAMAYTGFDPSSSDFTLGKQGKPEIVGPRTTPFGDFWKNAVEKVSRSAVFVQADDASADRVNSALQFIRDHALESTDEIERTIEFLCLFQGAPFRSASHPHYFGALFLRADRSPEEIALSIVHETAHQELFLLNLLDRLVQAEFDFHLVHAPYQGKIRPPIGRLHSAHALFRMLKFERASGSDLFAKHSRTLADTIASFSEGELTPFSKELVHEIYAEAIH